MPDSDNICDICHKRIPIGGWPWCDHSTGAFTQGPEPGTNAAERVVVYESAQEGGHIQYPGRVDVPVPARLRARGYVRRELNVRDLASFEKKHGVANERRHYDRNGKTD